MTETRTARDEFDGGRLAAIDAALTAHGDRLAVAGGTSTRRPGSEWDSNVGLWVIPGEYTAWQAEGDRLARELADANADAKGIICNKCSGRGRIIRYNHRTAGLCYTCNGDGWTAKGRRLHAKGQA